MQIYATYMSFLCPRGQQDSHAKALKEGPCEQHFIYFKVFFLQIVDECIAVQCGEVKESFSVVLCIYFRAYECFAVLCSLFLVQFSVVV